MAGIAFQGSPLQQSTASSYISYQYKVWNPRQTSYEEQHGSGTPEDPYWYETVYVGGYDFFSDTSNAIIDGSVTGGSSNVFVNGTAVTFQGAATTETWTNSGFKDTFVSASPATDGSGNGSVSSGSSTVFVNGNPIAFIGSSVTTCLGTTSTVTSGSSNVFAG